MFRTEIGVERLDLVSAYKDLYDQMPDLVQVIVDREVHTTGEQLLAELRIYPGKVVYPIRWKSEKQRKAFFATNGFGHGIPYVRTGYAGKAWKLLVELSYGEISRIILINENPYRRFLTGADRQPFHSLTGWVSDQAVIDFYAELMVDNVETGILRAWEAVG